VQPVQFERSSGLPEVIIVRPDVHRDGRGHFIVTYQARVYAQYGVGARFVQDNQSSSRGGVLRGLHYQLGQPHGKLVRAVTGEIYDVAVDIRRGSPTFGRWTAATLSAQNATQLFVPEGFAHGFCVLSDAATVAYKCTDFYAPDQERGVRWDDPDLAIDWPVADPILSQKDQAYPPLRDVPPEDLPPYEENP
jgi:dTDP-4-dehydrorhamnose 3,5-epimerase